jgi:hypothetical protein
MHHSERVATARKEVDSARRSIEEIATVHEILVSVFYQILSRTMVVLYAILSYHKFRMVALESIPPPPLFSV